MTLSADHDLSVSAPFEVLADRAGDFVSDPLTQGLSNGDMLAGNQHLHKLRTRQSLPTVKRREALVEHVILKENWPDHPLTGLGFLQGSPPFHR